MQKKALILGAMKNGDPSEKTKILLEKIHNIAGDGEDGEGDPDEEFDEERGKGGPYSNILYHILILCSPEVDSEFDDDDLGGDYNAETYFDNGEDGSEGEGGGNDEEY
jgi:DNA-directed RNA polymerase III subunit RPC7